MTCSVSRVQSCASLYSDLWLILILGFKVRNSLLTLGLCFTSSQSHSPNWLAAFIVSLPCQATHLLQTLAAPVHLGSPPISRPSQLDVFLHSLVKALLTTFPPASRSLLGARTLSLVLSLLKTRVLLFSNARFSREASAECPPQ